MELKELTEIEGITRVEYECGSHVKSVHCNSEGLTPELYAKISKSKIVKICDEPFLLVMEHSPQSILITPTYINVSKITEISTDSISPELFLIKRYTEKSI